MTTRFFKPPTPGSARGMRVMAVHAHPDDETAATGGLLARVAADGGEPCVITCTDGRQATSFDPAIPSEPSAMARARVGELSDACAALGVTYARSLGYHDSGMAGSATSRTPDAFAMAKLDDVVQRLVKEIREFRPQVIATYDERGGYGHPDHVKTHQATVAAFRLAANAAYHPELGPAWSASKLYFRSIPATQMRVIAVAAKARGMANPALHTEPQYGLFGYPNQDSHFTTAIDCRDVWSKVRSAFAAHRSQFPPGFFLLAVDARTGARYFGVEHYHLAQSRVAVKLPESDVFSGIT